MDLAGDKLYTNYLIMIFDYNPRKQMLAGFD